jgi:hypothetical protein
MTAVIVSMRTLGALVRQCDAHASAVTLDAELRARANNLARALGSSLSQVRVH